MSSTGAVKQGSPAMNVLHLQLCTLLQENRESSLLHPFSSISLLLPFCSVIPDFKSLSRSWTEYKWHTSVASGRESYPVHLNHALWLYLFLMGYTPVEESKQHFHFHSWRPAWAVSALLVWGCSHSLPLPAAGAQWCRGRCRRHTSVESSHHNSSYLNPDLH